MTKKNTLLYLDENLVQKAKEMNINISKLTENAIKSKVFPLMSEGQKILFDVEKYLESLEEQNRCFRLPHTIEKVKLNNIGPIDEFEETFEPLTAVKGSCGSGKTFLLRSIAHACSCIGEDLSNFLKDGKESGKIEVKTIDRSNTSVSIEGENTERKGDKCLLIDDPLHQFEKEKRRAFIRKLKEQYVDEGWQIILTDKFFEEDDLVEKVIELKKEDDIK